MYVANQLQQGAPYRYVDNFGAHGITAAPAEKVLRVQLKLPPNQGLVVSRVTPGSPAAQSGIRPHDVLLSVNEKPVSSWQSLQTVMNQAGQERAVIKLLREGAKMTLEMKTLPSANNGLRASFDWRQDFIIGVNVAPVDATLRAQLKLPKDEGLVITQVYADQPAEKAGFKLHDVLLSINDEPVPNLKSLQQQLRASKGGELSVVMLRSGKRYTLSITPQKREGGWIYGMPTTFPAHGVVHYASGWRPETGYLLYTAPAVATPATKAMDVNSQLGALAKQLQELRDAVESLRDSINKEAK